MPASLYRMVVDVVRNIRHLVQDTPVRTWYRPHYTVVGHQACQLDQPFELLGLDPVLSAML